MKDGVSGMLLALTELPVGRSAEVAALGDELRGSKKFADVGVVPGMKLGSSIALHRSEGKNIQERKY